MIKDAKERSRIALIGSLIIIVIIIGIGVASYYVGKKEGAEQKSPIPVIDLSRAAISQPVDQRVLGAETYSWSGEVINIDEKDSKLFFIVKSRNSQKETQSQNLIAVINSKTQLRKWNLTQPSVDQAGSNREIIPLSAFNAGNQITVRANNDVNGDGVIEASSIDLLITPVLK